MPLVEEERLDLPPALLEFVPKEIQLKGLRGRFRTNRLETANLHLIPGSNQGHPAKLPGIVVAELRPVRKLEDNVGMLVNRSADGLAEVLALHPQVRNHRQVVAEPKEKVLAAPVNILNRLTDQGLTELLNIVGNRLAIVNINCVNLASLGNLQ